MRVEGPEIFEGSIFKDLIYADDVTSLFAHPEAHRTPVAACGNALIIGQVLTKLVLALSFPGSLDFVISPGLIAGRVFKRMPNPHRRSNKDRPLLHHQTATMHEDLSVGVPLETKVFSPAYRNQLPL